LAQTLVQQRHLATLFKDLATLRTTAQAFATPEDLRWRGPTPAFEALCGRIDAANLSRWAQEFAPTV
jgi:hypothetical protein